jgi:hypothetical protein
VCRLKVWLNWFKWKHDSPKSLPPLSNRCLLSFWRKSVRWKEGENVAQHWKTTQQSAKIYAKATLHVKQYFGLESSKRFNGKIVSTFDALLTQNSLVFTTKMFICGMMNFKIDSSCQGLVSIAMKTWVSLRDMIAHFIFTWNICIFFCPWKFRGISS